MSTLLIAFVGSFALALLLTPLAGRAAHRWGLVDKPDGKLKKHHRVIPYGGGAALYLSSAPFFLLLGSGLDPEGRRRIQAALLGGTMVFLLGLLDDKWRLPPWAKFLGQGLAALVAMAGGLRAGFIATPGLGSALTLIWIVGMTNALNLIDIMDGLAAGVALIGCLAFFLIGLPGEAADVDLVSAGLAGALLAFLRYNFFPAKIFMGDAGSLYLGYMLSALALGARYTAVNPAGLFAPLLILGVPLFDTALVMVLRTLRGIPFYLGSPDHLAIRLERIGLSVRAVVFSLYALSGLLSAAAWVITRVSTERAVFIYVLTGMGLLVAGQLASDVEVRKAGKKHP